MSSSILGILTTALVSFALGFVAGQFVDFRKIGPHEVKPEMHRPRPDGRGFRIALIALFIASCTFLVDFTLEQRRCNDRLIDTIQARSQLNGYTEEARRDDGHAGGRYRFLHLIGPTVRRERGTVPGVVGGIQRRGRGQQSRTAGSVPTTDRPPLRTVLK